MSHGFARISTANPWENGIDLRPMSIAPANLMHGELTERIIGVFYDVYNELGYGFLESTYSGAMLIALHDAGLSASCEVSVSVPVWFRGRKVGQYFADLLVNDRVLVELKTGRNIESSHESQLLHYLRATEIEVRLLLNFGVRPQFRRLLFDNPRKKIRANPCESVAEVLG